MVFLKKKMKIFYNIHRLNVLYRTLAKKIKMSYFRPVSRFRTWSRCLLLTWTLLPINKKAFSFTNKSKEALSLFPLICCSIQLTTLYFRKWTILATAKLNLAIGHAMRPAEEVLILTENISYFLETVKSACCKSFSWDKLSHKTEMNMKWCWQSLKSSTERRK